MAPNGAVCSEYRIWLLVHRSSGLSPHTLLQIWQNIGNEKKRGGMAGGGNLSHFGSQSQLVNSAVTTVGLRLRTAPPSTRLEGKHRSPLTSSFRNCALNCFLFWTTLASLDVKLVTAQPGSTLTKHLKRLPPVPVNDGRFLTPRQRQSSNLSAGRWEGHKHATLILLGHHTDEASLPYIEHYQQSPYYNCHALELWLDRVPSTAEGSKTGRSSCSPEK
ncbi:hypothetical protein Cob_v008566 [Colletotrichum orbiculare MAFF 240422]|uniref:Uncharacterized protein n=1 Tax=Colletotrichum orbiculare (strain 104-T / ATCC 96160 / CBS 514.97 / LARS 414 / MAFF 240422) TaxID=1213857 RepID=A0A484FJB3_COLOR|nr:hypothetical protein Cob_v008566 [Colletotrichum orbiculare MAFF 240422]